MPLSGKLVQVPRPSTENSLAQGVVGMAWVVSGMGIDDVETGDMYLLEPESAADHEKVAGLLFTEAELEELP